MTAQTEIAPQFIVTPDQELVFNLDPTLHNVVLERLGWKNDDEDYQGTFLRDMEKLAEQPGIAVAEQPEGRYKVVAGIEERFGESFHVLGDPNIETYLSLINRHLPHPEFVNRDMVVSLDMLGAWGAHTYISPQFQRWINAGNLSEEVVREVFGVMALPFGEEVQEQVAGQLNYFSTETKQAAQAFCMRISARPQEIPVERCVGTEQHEGHDWPIYERGKAEWRIIDLTTLGNCACLGLDWAGRGNFRNREGEVLYQLTPHNVDYARQSLSQLMGMGVMARIAAGYEGREDIYAGVEWERSR